MEQIIVIESGPYQETSMITDPEHHTRQVVDTLYNFHGGKRRKKEKEQEKEREKKKAGEGHTERKQEKSKRETEKQRKRNK